MYARTVITSFALVAFSNFVVAAPLQLGDIVVSNQNSGNLYRVAPTSGTATLLTTDNLLFDPNHVIIDAQGRIITVERSIQAGRAVVRFDPTTGVQSRIASTAYTPTALAFDANNNLIIGNADDQLIRMDPVTGAQILLATLTNVQSIQDVEVDNLGRIVVLDFGVFPSGTGSKIVRFDLTTGQQTTISNTFVNPVDLVIRPTGDYVVSNRISNTTSEIVRVDPITGSQQILASLPSEGFIALKDQNTILYADFDGDLSILRVDLLTGQTQTLSNFQFPREITGIAIYVPEPSPLLLAALGTMSLALARCRRNF
jgi:hypothetical protein